MSEVEATIADTSLQIRHTFPVSVSRLFDCFTDPALLAEWWGPKGTRCPAPQIDLRGGGRYRFEIHSEDGTRNAANGEFIEIDPPNRLTFSWYWDATPEEATRVTLNFRALSSHESELHLVHEHFPEGERTTRHATGWTSSLDRLVDVLSSAENP